MGNKNNKPKANVDISSASPIPVAASQVSTGLDSNEVELEVEQPSTNELRSHDSRPSFGNLAWAVIKIQRKVRHTLAFRRAFRNEWKLFNAFDQWSESDNLQLAYFIQALMELTPTGLGGSASPPSSPRSSEQVIRSLGEGMETAPAPQKAAYNAQAASHIMVDGIDFSEQDDIINYSFSGVVTPKIVAQIIELCRCGGRLSTHSMHRVLRASYKRLLTMPNVTRLTLSPQSKATIIGDIHGQLDDLLFILDNAGMPSESNIFVFNGDWVDRGQHSVEVITIIFVLFLAYPNFIALNRGNHEDGFVNAVYGFEAECNTKYPWLNNSDPEPFTFKMFVEVFKHLPLFTMINSQVFIVHGGLFHSLEVSIDDLNEIQRSHYTCKPSTHYQKLSPMTPPEQMRKEFLQQIMRDALWSDPRPDIDGVAVNTRGSGIFFGQDVAQRWMESNKIRLVIRSHECEELGFNFPYSEQTVKVMRGAGGKTIVRFDEEDTAPRLVTLFSASNYTGATNEGAFMTIMPHKFADATPIPPLIDEENPSDLHFSITRFRLSKREYSSFVRSNRKTLLDILLRSKMPLLLAFQALDKSQTGIVSRLEWLNIMTSVTGIQIRWLSIIDALVPAAALTARSVSYQTFINSLQVPQVAVPAVACGTSAVVERLYTQRRRLEHIFKFFDANGDGKISKDELSKGVGALTKALPADSAHIASLSDIAHILDLMDLDHDGCIDVNEFMEVFRHLDSLDGCEDGKISIVSQK